MMSTRVVAAHAKLRSILLPTFLLNLDGDLVQNTRRDRVPRRFQAAIPWIDNLVFLLSCASLSPLLPSKEEALFSREHRHLFPNVAFCDQADHACEKCERQVCARTVYHCLAFWWTAYSSQCQDLHDGLGVSSLQRLHISRGCGRNIPASVTDTSNEDVAMSAEEDEQAEEDSIRPIPFKRITLDFTPLSSYNTSLIGLPPRLIVRSEYEELATFAETVNRHTILTGQPGVGKSYALYYLLARRLSCGLPTIFAKSDDQWYFFCDLGVYLLNPTYLDDLLEDFAQIHASDPVGAREILQRRAIILFDSRAEEPFPRISGLAQWRYIVASSSNRKRYKHWMKENEALFWVMRTWSWSEIYAAREMQKGNIATDVNQLWTAFTKFSHAARVVYKIPTQVRQDAVTDALFTLSPQLLASMMRSAESVHADISSQLVEVNPYIGSDGQVNRSRIIENIATRFILDRLVRQTAIVQNVGLRRTFEALYAEPAGRASAGTVFELAAHAVMMRQSEREVRSLMNGSISTIIFKHGSDIVFDTGGLDSDQKEDVLQGRLYCRPGVLNFPGIDSFTVVDGSPVVFQMTVGLSHPVKISGLEHISRLLGTTNIRSKRWSLVFVVPKGNAGNFTTQAMNPPHKRKNWEHRVDQYVLGLDHNELWPTAV